MKCQTYMCACHHSAHTYARTDVYGIQFACALFLGNVLLALEFKTRTCTVQLKL